MAPFFYFPHTKFVAEHGLDHFEVSMRAQYELTKRFSAESSIRPYIAEDPERTFATLRQWTQDSNAARSAARVRGYAACVSLGALRFSELDEQPGVGSSELLDVAQGR